ncbi:MAG: hypothetical protein ACI4DX_15910 [Oliverpabstia sp.]
MVKMQLAYLKGIVAVFIVTQRLPNKYGPAIFLSDESCMELKEALEREEYRHVLKPDARKPACGNVDWRV